jgi:hypothetical protein
MTDPEPRSGPQRKADTLARLQGHEVDVWVASASASGSGAAHPCLVPLTLAWIDERVVIAVEETSRTARNIVQHRTAQAWREVNELPGRTLMRDGSWLV